MIGYPFFTTKAGIANELQTINPERTIPYFHFIKKRMEAKSKKCKKWVR
jgi:hypothetical protein